MGCPPAAPVVPNPNQASPGPAPVNPLGAAAADPIPASQPSSSEPISGTPDLVPVAPRPSADPALADPVPAASSSADPVEARWGQPEFWGAVTRSWKPYQHSSGFRLKLPSGWTVRDAGASLTLRTRDPSLKGLGFGVGHVSLPDVKDVGNPEQFRGVQATFVSGLAQYSFKATDEQIRSVDIGGQRIAATSLLGVSPRTGDDVFCVLYLTQVGSNRDGHFMFVLSGDSALLQSRGRFLARALISSFANRTSPSATGGSGVAAGASRTSGSVDANALGRWLPSSAYSSGGFSVTSANTLQLREDGTCLLSKKTAGAEQVVNRGRWSAAGGTLTLAWENAGRGVYDYEILSVYTANDNMLWTTPERVRWRRAE